MFTLKHFADSIVKPTILAFIESGRADAILLDGEVLEIIAKDKELLSAFVSRIPALRERHGDI
jgi:hypothetical protein